MTPFLPIGLQAAVHDPIPSLLGFWLLLSTPFLPIGLLAAVIDPIPSYWASGAVHDPIPSLFAFWCCS